MGLLRREKENTEKKLGELSNLNSQMTEQNNREKMASLARVKELEEKNEQTRK